MKLYYSKGACSLAPRIIIHELGVNCDFEAVDLKTKQTETGEDYLKINPKGSVPALVTEDNEILTENAVIQQYLADRYHNETLLPKTDQFKRYRVLEWLNFISSDLHKIAGALFLPTLSNDTKDQVFKPLLKSKLNFVNKKLTKTFLMGDDFTLPDSYLFVILSWLPLFNIPLSEWPALERYFNNMKNRAAVITALKEEGFPVGAK